MAPLCSVSSRRSEMHIETASNLALHNTLFSCVYSNGLFICGARGCNENNSFRIPYSSSKHV
uniref:Putative ovule protein n=1 Tax=Solanum chacoense TaxID=4108 RepID=A0A0V0GNR8_SOLCH